MSNEKRLGSEVSDVVESILDAVTGKVKTTIRQKISPDVALKHSVNHKQLRKKTFIDCAIKLISTNGANISMDDIAREAGVTKPVLYRYFKDRNSLIEELSKLAMSALENELAESLTFSLNGDHNEHAELDHELYISTALTTYVRFVENNTYLYSFLTSNETKDIESFIKRFASIISVALDREFKYHSLYLGPTELYSNAIVGMVHLATLWWINNRNISRDRFVESLTRFILQGLTGELLSNAINIK